MLRCVNPAALLPLVRYYSIRLPRRVAKAEWTTAVDKLIRPVSSSPVISACWRLIHYDVKISGPRIRTHDLWIRKRVCYPLHHSASQERESSKGEEVKKEVRDKRKKTCRGLLKMAWYRAPKGLPHPATHYHLLQLQRTVQSRPLPVTKYFKRNQCFFLENVLDLAYGNAEPQNVSGGHNPEPRLEWRGREGRGGDRRRGEERGNWHPTFQTKVTSLCKIRLVMESLHSVKDIEQLGESL